MLCAHNRLRVHKLGAQPLANGLVARFNRAGCFCGLPLRLRLGLDELRVYNLRRLRCRLPRIWRPNTVLGAIDVLPLAGRLCPALVRAHGQGYRHRGSDARRVP